VVILKRITEQVSFVKSATKGIFEAMAKQKREKERNKNTGCLTNNTSENYSKKSARRGNRYDKIFDFIDKTNAIEHLSNWIEATIKETKIQNMIPIIASNAAQDTFRQIEDIMEEMFFEENNRKLCARREALKVAVENRVHAADDLVALMEVIERDHCNLKKIVESMQQH
jgi:hypothetical protein